MRLRTDDVGPEDVQAGVNADEPALEDQPGHPVRQVQRRRSFGRLGLEPVAASRLLVAGARQLAHLAASASKVTKRVGLKLTFVSVVNRAPPRNQCTGSPAPSARARCA